MPEKYEFKIMNYGKLFRAARALVFAALALAFIIHNSEFLHATTVTGTVRDSAGKAVSGAAISFRLINIGRGNVARDSGTSIVAPAVVTVSSGSDGTFSLTLVGNDSITPSGTLYEVVIRGQGFTYGPFDYSITGASADLNSLTPQATYPNTPSQVSSSQLVPPSGCAVGQDLEWTGTAWICGASGSGATIETNGVENAVQGALDFQTSEDNGVGLTLTPVYQTGGGEKFEITGSNYSGNSATATALASVPTQCTAGQFATGITASGNANCGTPAGGGGTPGGLSGQVQYNNGVFGGAANLLYDSASGRTTIAVADKGGQVFNVKAYGAKGNGKSYFDGVTSSGGASGNAINTGNSTTPSVAAVTTTVNNAIAIGVFQADTDWSVAPSVGTNRVTLPSVISYALTVNDQIKATAGTVASYGGTLASSVKWNTGHFWMSPAAGQSISFVSENSNQVASGSGITATSPAGIVQGDTVIACLGYFTGSNSITWPSGMSVRFSATQANGPGLECRSEVAGASPPASFTWSQTNTVASLSAVVLDYRNIATSSNLFLSSATANFNASQIGDPICVAGIGAGSGQICGTIASFVSTSQVGLSSAFDSGSAGTGLWFNFGTNDDSAFSSALTAAQATPGGIVYAPCGNYVLTSALSIAPNKPIIIRGCGPGASNTESNYLNGYSPYNLNVGTVLQFDTTSLATGAVSFKGGSFTTNVASGYALENLTVYGGAGKARDGGGKDGVAIIAFPWVTLKNVWVANFSGQGVYIDYLGNAAGQGWITNVALDRVFSFWNGGYGVKVGSTFTGHRLENISIDEAEIENNGGPGLGLVGANIQGFSLTNSLVQWNNVSAANPEIQISSTSVSGCRIQSNYIEGPIAGTGSQSNNWITPNVTSCVAHPNYVNGFGSTANAGLSTSWLTRSTPGTFASLPACSATFEGTTTAITDSTTNVSGATVTGGGTNHVLGYCNGSNWTVMGE